MPREGERTRGNGARLAAVSLPRPAAHAHPLFSETVGRFRRSTLRGGLPAVPALPPRPGRIAAARPDRVHTTAPPATRKAAGEVVPPSNPSPARQHPAHGLCARLTVLPLYGRPPRFGR